MWSISASHPHCHAQFHQLPPPTPTLPNRAARRTMGPLNLQPSQPQRPPTLAGSSDSGGCRMGRPAAGWDSYWVFERWARSSHLPTSSIMPHKRTQIKTTHSCLRSHYHIQALSSLFSASLSLMWAKALRRKKEDQSSGSPSLLEAMRAPEERARWWSDSCLLVEISFWAKMTGSQKDWMERGGARETGDKGRATRQRRNKDRGENISIHIVVFYFLSCSSHSIESKCITVTL